MSTLKASGLRSRKRRFTHKFPLRAYRLGDSKVVSSESPRRQTRMRQEFYAKDRRTWRKWLENNHLKKQNIWLIIFKKESDTPSVYYNDAVEEALCFGWIDSTANKRDDKSFLLFFVTRKPKSGWSKVNKQRIERLNKLNLMTSAGQEKIEMAKKDGTWTMLDAIERLIMPAVLKKEFNKNKIALKYFEAFPPSVKKSIFHWIQSAKREETSRKRIVETVTLAAKNIRANQWKPGR